MSFDLSAQSRKLAVSNLSVTVSLLICLLHLNVQLLIMSEVLALIKISGIQQNLDRHLLWEIKTLYFNLHLTPKLEGFEQDTRLKGTSGQGAWSLTWKI